MQVGELMTQDVRLAAPQQSIQDAACLMKELDVGLLPVGEDDRLVGMITDRDIALRAVADGKGPKTPVREVMTEEVRYCFDDQEVEQVVRNMAAQQLRRLPVLNRGKRLIGILSLADIATMHSVGAAGAALSGIARPGGRHRQ